MSQEEEEEEVNTSSPTPNTGSDNDSPSSWLEAASLSTPESLPEDNSTPTREELALLTPLPRRTPRFAVPQTRRNRYLERHRPLTPAQLEVVDTTRQESLISTQSPLSTENRATEAQTEGTDSALSGFSPGESTDSSLPTEPLFTSGNTEESIDPEEVIQNESEDNNGEDDDNDNSNSPNDKPTPSTAKTVTMPSLSASFDTELQHLVTDIMLIKLTDNAALALQETGMKSFDDFRTMDIDDAKDLVYPKALGTVVSTTHPLQQLAIKKIIRTIHYCHYCEDDRSDAYCDNPLNWDPIIFSKWCRNGIQAWIERDSTKIGTKARA